MENVSLCTRSPAIYLLEPKRKFCPFVNGNNNVNDILGIFLIAAIDAMKCTPFD
jgi:hypothetical protein